MNYKIGRLAGVVAAVTVWLAPGLAAAQAPVAAVVMYEVAESLTFKVPKHTDDLAQAKRRLASATLIGRTIVPFTADPASPWTGAQFMSTHAQSSISLISGTGPIRGTFDVLKDLDPTRESLDTLIVMSSGQLHGVLDLSTSASGYASTSGTWQVKNSKGTFAGVFVVPFPYEAGYAYVDLTQALGLAPLGLSFCDASRAVTLPGGAPGCRLGSEEFALGIPLTKALIILSTGE